MKPVVTFIFLLFNLTFVSQEPSKVSNNSIGIYISPSVTTNTNNYNSNEFYSSSSLKYSTHYGFKYKKKLNNKLSMESGISVLNFGFNEFGSTEGDSKNHNYSENFKYLSVPLSLIYNLKQFYVGLGINSSYMLSHKHTKDNTTTIDQSPRHFGKYFSPIEYWLFGVQGKIGKVFHLSNKIFFYTEIFYLLDEQITISEFKIWEPYGFYSIGINFGTNFNF